MSTLFVTATPIGNLEDISLRAIRVFSEVQVILAEDTRHFLKLKSHLEATQSNYTINAKILRFDEHTESNQLSSIIELLDAGNDIALVSDAGTPLLSDPGYLLIRTISSQTDHLINAIPGPSAITTALSISGLPIQPFMFIGFLPVKEAKLTTTLRRLTNEREVTYVAFESPHRIEQTVSVFNQIALDETLSFTVAIVNELTKIHEKVIRLKLPLKPEDRLPEIKGEITLVWRY